MTGGGTMNKETGASEPISGFDEDEVPLTGWIDRTLGISCAAILASMAAVILLQIFMRYVIENPLVWGDEVIRILMVWITFLGATLAYRTKSHIAINSLENSEFVRSRPNFGKVLSLGIEFFILIGSLALLIGGIVILSQTASHTTPALEIPIGVFFAPAPLCGGVVLYSAAARSLTRGSSRGEVDS